MLLFFIMAVIKKKSSHITKMRRELFFHWKFSTVCKVSETKIKQLKVTHTLQSKYREKEGGGERGNDCLFFHFLPTIYDLIFLLQSN